MQERDLLYRRWIGLEWGAMGPQPMGTTLANTHWICFCAITPVDYYQPVGGPNQMISNDTKA